MSYCFLTPSSGLSQTWGCSSGSNGASLTGGAMPLLAAFSCSSAHVKCALRFQWQFRFMPTQHQLRPSGTSSWRFFASHMLLQMGPSCQLRTGSIHGSRALTLHRSSSGAALVPVKLRRGSPTGCAATAHEPRSPVSTGFTPSSTLCLWKADWSLLHVIGEELLMRHKEGAASRQKTTRTPLTALIMPHRRSRSAPGVVGSGKQAQLPQRENAKLPSACRSSVPWGLPAWPRSPANSVPAISEVPLSLHGERCAVLGSSRASLGEAVPFGEVLGSSTELALIVARRSPHPRRWRWRCHPSHAGAPTQPPAKT
mmetsp:Transcript_61589/g.170756  ORF Transcript_61589/g.170756 Transcript_61589/m.170756 type:complete len:312 (+) Transcript_61589:1129-2064(+)